MSRPVLKRVVARLLPVNAAGQVLLLHGWDPAAPGRPYWFFVGGGAEPGEDLAAAAVREMFEETGVVVDPARLGEPVAAQHVVFDWGPWQLDQDETYFAIGMEEVPVHFDGLEPLEVGTIDEARWWTPDALDADGTAADAHITRIMRSAVAAVRER
jgi:8-oxo-dGTP pyrophosphatase MutT (NUDIX family)